MPVPLAPVAAAALRWGIPLLAALAVTQTLRATRPGRTDQRAENVLDDVDEGLAVHRPKDRGQTNGAARFRRTVQVGGRRIEIDAAGLFRFRVRRLP